MWGSSQGFYHFETKLKDFIIIAGCIKTVCVIEFSALNQSRYRKNSIDSEKPVVLVTTIVFPGQKWRQN